MLQRTDLHLLGGKGSPQVLSQGFHCRRSKTVKLVFEHRGVSNTRPDTYYLSVL